MRTIRLLLLLRALGSFSLAADDSVDLEGGFLHPPDHARPWVYWFVMDGNLGREGITADLEAMKRVGIGGVLFMEVDVGIPKGPVKFMSAPWRELFQHANAEAARLGLVMTMPASPGWTGSGGPWVKPEHSMQELVYSGTNLVGPQSFSSVLPHGASVAGFYRDVAVIAFPTPVEDVRIGDLQEKALYRRGHFSSESGVMPRLPSLANYVALSQDQIIPFDRVVDLTRKMDAQGRLVWVVPEGRWTVIRFGHTSTGANTRPAPAPGLGLECDKFDRAALEAHFHDFLGKLLSDIGPLAGKSLVSLHIDSWEMGPQNWTARFPVEFRSRRGYDLLRYLPVMTGRVVTSQEASERFLWDLRQTALELITENHAAWLAQLAHRHGLGLSIEPYDGTPCDDMTYGSRSDIPMGEFWRDTFKTWFSCTEASSIAHTRGKRIVQAEAFTSGDGERWLAYPGSLKALGDWAFCDGINRFVFHRYAHQPWLDRWPGMTMGPYGIHYERTQTWFEQSKAWLDYLARCQYLLQLGLFVADVCFLEPEASPQVFCAPPTATCGDPPERHGYNFDGMTPETLLTRASVKHGRLVLPDGMSYRVLVLPETETMTPRLLLKIRSLVKAGATVIGAPPLKSPSLSGYPQCDEDVSKLARELWGAAPGSRPRRYGKGVVVSVPRTAAKAAPEAKDSLNRAKWIWCREGNAAVSAPVGKRYFQRSISVEGNEGIERALVCMTADNAFELWINGQKAGGGDNFHVGTLLDVTAMLKSGRNLLAVQVVNGGETANPAGLIGALAINYKNGHQMEIITDSAWNAARAPGSRWPSEMSSADGWESAMELGPAGMGPWGDITTPTPQPEVFCDFSIVADFLSQRGIAPDFESDGPLRYIHRRTTQADIYFVANREDRVIQADCVFRLSGKQPEVWDPLTGIQRTLPEFTIKDGRTAVPMRFEPAQSFFVVFRKPLLTSVAVGRNFPEPKRAGDLTGPWEVSFQPRWGGPEKITFQNLDDWSKRPEEGIRHYSGTATYHKTFDLPPGIASQRDQNPAATADRVYLDLGVVKNLAQVRLNGHDLGAIWCAPWRVDITSAVQARSNQLEISVVNLWPNRLIGDLSLPPEKRLTWTTWNPFTKEAPLLESGLLGPLSLWAQHSTDDSAK